MKSSQVTLDVSEAAPPNVCPADFATFLPWACRQLMAPFQVIVLRELRKDVEPPGKSARSRTRLSAQPASTHTINESELSTEDEFTIALTAIYDSSNLVEIQLVHRQQIPQLLFKIIALCIPYNPALRKITVRWSQLQGSFFYEISKFLPQSTITEICLDDSISYEAKYDLLLQTAHLKILSLARCKIGDAVCGNIASELECSKPASKGLVVLNLTSNMLTDISARKIGLALRGNRQLRYLNLSGNLITDEGAAHILRSLMEFPLTDDDVLEKRMRRVAYLTTRLKAYECYIERLNSEVQNKSPDKVSKETTEKSEDESKKMSSFYDSDETEARTMTDDLIGVYEDPYSNEETIFKDDCVYCVGNMSLCSLNLAFNNLEYPTVVKLCEVLDYQNNLTGRRQTGLVRVIIEGNNVPSSCRELQLARQFLDVILERQSELGYNSDKAKTKK